MTGDVLPASGLTGLDYLMVAVYMVGVLGMGIYFSRRQTTSEDYFLGGRRMPWLVVGISVMATLLSTISYLAVPGEMIKHGVGILYGKIAIPFYLVVVAYLILPFFMRLKITSAYEYLEKRFNLSVRLFGAGLFCLIRVFWMSLVIYTASKALTEMTDIRIYYVVLCVGLIATVYTMLGGIQAVIWSDLIQFLILVAGAIIAIGCVALRTHTGPVAWWQDLQSVGHDAAPLLPASISDRISIVGIVIHVFFWYVCTNGSDQVAIQRYLTTPSLSAARRSYLVSAVADLTLTLLLAVCGMALFSYFFRQPELFAQIFDSGTLAERADDVFPRFISTQLPSGVGGLIVAALFAAAMSSLDSGVNSMATVVTVDFYRRLKHNADPNRELMIAKIVTVVAGCLVTLVACLIAYRPQTLGRNIVEMTNYINGFVVGPLAGVMFAGMFIKRCSAPAVLVGGVAGMVIGLCVSFSQKIFGMEEPISFVYTISVPCLSTMLVAVVVSIFIPEKNPQRLKGLVWGLGQAGVQQAE